MSKFSNFDIPVLILLRLIGKELSRRLIRGVDLHFPHLRVHIVNIETIVSQNQELITQVDHHQHQFIIALAVCFSQMKPLFSKMEEKVVYHPGDPGRKEFEEKWKLAGGKPEEMEGQVITVENTEVAKVSFSCHQHF